MSVAAELQAKARAFVRIGKVVDKRWKGLTSSKYVTRTDEGAIDEVLCKRCGNVLRKGGAETRAYSEVQLDFSDGSRHITPLCTKCSSGLKHSDLEAIYCADMLELSNEEEMAKVLLKWSLMSDRKIVGHRKHR